MPPEEFVEEYIESLKEHESVSDVERVQAHLRASVKRAMGDNSFMYEVMEALSFFAHKDITFDMLMSVMEELDPNMVCWFHKNYCIISFQSLGLLRIF